MTDLFHKINYFAGQNIWLDRFMIFSAEWLGYLLIAGVIFFFLKNRQKYKEMLIVSIGSAAIARFVFVEVIRWLYYSPRPFLVTTDFVQLINHETTSSFPSGHTTFYFALATGIYLYNKKVGYAYFALAGLIGFARIFGGVHWPLDIIGGAVLGVVTAVLTDYFNKKTR